MSAEIPGEILDRWEGNVTVGGDMPGMVRYELPVQGEGFRAQIEEDHELGVIPKNKRRGMVILGPLLENGRKIKVVYKMELEVKDFFPVFRI